jgi:hypothetical protein
MGILEKPKARKALSDCKMAAMISAQFLEDV